MDIKKCKSFGDWWNSLSKPLPGNRKGYKKGAIDGWLACDKTRSKEINDLTEYLEKLEKYLKCPMQHGIKSRVCEKCGHDDEAW